MLYSFSDCVLDTKRRELRRGSQLNGIEPQVFDLLVYLVQNGDRVVSKDDLLEGVWGGRVVSDSTLASRMNAVRKAIGDSGETQALIRTFPKKGFRFVGAVRAMPEPQNTDGGVSLPITDNHPSEPQSPPERVIPASRAYRRTRMTIFGGIAALCLFVSTAIFLVSEAGSPPGAITEPDSGVAAVREKNIAVAVLPFANLSGDLGQEFFSDGITEEVTSALSRIPGLRVVARSSAFQFKGQSGNIQAIAQALGATHLVEGSVRKDGDEVRVAVKLVRADGGLQIWSNSFDRRLEKVISLQTEIAQAIANALRVPLGLDRNSSLASIRDVSPDVYQRFLRAKALVHRRGMDKEGEKRVVEAISLLESFVKDNPDHADAWAQLGSAYLTMPFYFSEFESGGIEEKKRIVDAWLPKAEAASRKAIGLDPKLAEGYNALSTSLVFRGRLLEADALNETARSLDPFSPEGLHNRSLLLGMTGFFKESLALKQVLLSIEPFVPGYRGAFRDLYWLNGQTEKLIADMTEAGAAEDLAYLARLHVSGNRLADAVKVLQRITPWSFPEGNLEASISILNRAQTGAPAMRNIPQLSRRLDFVYAVAGVSGKVLEPFEAGVAIGFVPDNFLVSLWVPSHAEMRRTERFKTFVKNAGLLEYWKAKGWPEFCRPTTSDDFVCH